MTSAVLLVSEHQRAVSKKWQRFQPKHRSPVAKRRSFWEDGFLWRRESCTQKDAKESGLVALDYAMTSAKDRAKVALHMRGQAVRQHNVSEFKTCWSCCMEVVELEAPLSLLRILLQEVTCQ